MANKYHCSNCRENIAPDNLKKVSIANDGSRNVLFCGNCNCYVTIEETKTVPTTPK